MNSICVGFSNAQLASLVFNTTTSINVLGALTTWSSGQLASTVLGVPVTNYINNFLSGIITSDFQSAAGNLLCTLTQAQINSIPTFNFT